MTEQRDNEEEDLGPGKADYDLSEEHGYLWDPAHPSWPPRWLIAAVTALIIAGLILPAIILILCWG